MRVGRNVPLQPVEVAHFRGECLRVAVQGGMPVLLLSAGQAGATAPAYLAGTVSQSASADWSM